MNHILVLCTASSEVEAKSIAHDLVERKLAACVNIVGPMQSVYRWKGAVDEAQEYLLLIKTGAEHFESVRDAIVSLHSYEVPEVIQLSIKDGLPAYLSWISEALE
jgi:periplasmic divalent cation tolerance protein